NLCRRKTGGPDSRTGLLLPGGYRSPLPLNGLNNPCLSLLYYLLFQFDAIFFIRKSGSVQATFLFAGIFPPPPSSAEILTFAHGAGTWRTSNAGKSLVMQWVVRYVVGLGEAPYFLQRPVVDGMKFDQLMGFVPFHLGHVLAVVRLLCPDPGDPAGHPCQRPVQGFNLTDPAAFLSVFDRIIKTGRTLSTDQLLYSRCIRKIGLYLLLIDLQCPVPYVVGFGKQTTGFQCKNSYG